MATVAQLREGLRARLATITSLRAHAYQPDTVNITAGKAVVFPIPRATDDESFAGTEVTTFDVVLIAAPGQGTGYERGQKLLDPYLSRGDANDVKTAIEAEKTLGGVAHDLNVGPWRDYGLLSIGDVAYWHIKREVQIWH